MSLKQKNLKDTTPKRKSSKSINKKGVRTYIEHGFQPLVDEYDFPKPRIRFIEPEQVMIYTNTSNLDSLGYARFEKISSNIKRGLRLKVVIHERPF